MFKKITDKIKFLKSSSIYKRRVICPDKDWIFMIMSTFLFVIIFGFLGLWLFKIVSSGVFWKVDFQTEVREYKLNKKNLNDFFEYMDSKREKLDSGVLNIPNPFF